MIYECKPSPETKLSMALILGLAATVIYQFFLLDAAAEKIPDCPVYEYHKLASSTYNENTRILQCYYSLKDYEIKKRR